jgi:hypothetical protein
MPIDLGNEALTDAPEQPREDFRTPSQGPAALSTPSSSGKLIWVGTILVERAEDAAGSRANGNQPAGE